MEELLITCEGNYNSERAVFRFKLLDGIIRYVRVTTADMIVEYGITNYFTDQEVDNWATDNSIVEKITFAKSNEKIDSVLRISKIKKEEPYFIAYFKDEEEVKAAFGHMEKYDTLSESFKIPDDIKDVYGKDFDAIKELVKGYKKVLSR